MLFQSKCSICMCSVIFPFTLLVHQHGHGHLGDVKWPHDSSSYGLQPLHTKCHVSFALSWHKRGSCGTPAWSWPPWGSLETWSLDFSIPHNPTYQISSPYCTPMTLKKHLWFSDLDLHWELMVDVWENLNTGFLMPLLRPLLWIIILFDKVITAEKNWPHLTVLHKKVKFVFRPSLAHADFAPPYI